MRGGFECVVLCVGGRAHSLALVLVGRCSRLGASNPGGVFVFSSRLLLNFASSTQCPRLHPDNAHGGH